MSLDIETENESHIDDHKIMEDEPYEAETIEEEERVL